MAVKIYLAGGAINLSGLYADLIIINPAQFDWKIVGSKYSVRDAIENQNYKLGAVSNIQDKNGNSFTDNELIDYLNTLTNSSNITVSESPLSVQNPFPVDGDSIYAKDLDVSRCDLFGFSGSVEDLVSGLHTIVKDESTTNPKKILLHFKRSVLFTFLGIGNAEADNNPNAKDFSNIKIIGITSGGVEKVLIDQSSDNNGKTTYQSAIQAVGVNAIRFEFHTADGVGLTNIAIPKTVFVQQAPNVVFGSNNKSVLLTEVGGSPDMNIDGSSTPVDFFYEVPAGKTLKLERSFLAIKDGITDFTSVNFGAISSGLTNGVDVLISHAGIEYLLATWKTNFDISLTMYDFFNPYKDGAYAGRWTFSKDVGAPFSLEQGDKIIARVKDNLTALDLIQISIKGKI